MLHQQLPAVRHFGIASFGFYVFHQNVILAFTVIPALGENPWLIGICAFAASYLLAALSFRWIEHPINAWAKRRAAAWQKR